MRHVFSIRGHQNILCTHKNTLEFTKDKELSKKGDCIVGVEADFSISALKALVKNYRELKCSISIGKLKDSFCFLANPDFNDKHELVIRRSEFSSDRTLGIRTEKVAIDLDRKLVAKLKNKTKATVTIEPKIKLVIFDFDDTIEDYHSISHIAKSNIGKRINKICGADPERAVSLFKTVYEEKRRKGRGRSPEYYDIASWVYEVGRRLNVSLTKKQSQSIADGFWDDIGKLAKPMPYAKQVLNSLSKRYSLAILTDSDGLDDSFKIKRMKKLGLYDYFDVVITGNLVGQNKPSKKSYRELLRLFEVAPDECVMVGDKEDTDLHLAYDLGMKTVLMDKPNHYSEKQAHVDHHITSLKELLDIIK